MKPKKRIDKQPVRQITSNPHIRTIRKKNTDITFIDADGDFMTFYNALCAYFFSHNFWGMKPELMDKSVHMCAGLSHGKNALRICQSVHIEDPDICRVVFTPSVRGYVELYKIEVYNKSQGIGSILMNAFNEVSKQTGVKICLMLGDPTSDLRYNDDIHYAMRRAFYKRNGFKRSPRSEYWIN